MAEHATPIADAPMTRDAEERIIEAAEKILHSRFVRETYFSDPQAAGRYFRMKLSLIESEEFHVAFLDTRHGLITSECMFRGTIDGAEVHPREIVKRALQLNAAAVICAHQHPSGQTDPSAADRALTLQLKQALALVDVRLLDHFVVGGTDPGFVSMAARGQV